MPHQLKKEKEVKSKSKNKNSKVAPAHEENCILISSGESDSDEQHAINLSRISAYTESRVRRKESSRGGPSKIKGQGSSDAASISKQRKYKERQGEATPKGNVIVDADEDDTEEGSDAEKL